MENYEKNTGKAIIETFANIDYMAIPGVLVRSHGVFTWGENTSDSVHNAVVIEELAKMNYQSMQLNSNITQFPKYILDKHYNRKHGQNAYYGQINYK